MDNHWFKQAKKYLAWEGSLADSGGTVGDESANPGPIDNKPLWKEDGSDIREHMIDEMDYVLVPEEAWDDTKEESESGSKMLTWTSAKWKSVTRNC